MATDVPKAAWVAADAPGRRTSHYPPAFAQRVAGRVKRPLGELFGIASFGINLTTLEPGAQSSVKHRHTVQDEFVYVISGELVLVNDDAEIALAAGMCAGFPHGGGAHRLLNRSDAPATCLEVGDRRPGDSAEYPDDDLVAVKIDQEWRFSRKDGTPY